MGPLVSGALQRQWRHVTGAVRRSGVSSFVLVLLVAAIGVISASSVRLFEAAIEFLLEAGYHRLPALLDSYGLPHWAPYLLFPFALGLLVPGLKRLVPKPDRHHAIPLVIISMIRRDGAIRPLTTLLKTLGAVLTLGAGGSLGREGPVVLLGGGLGSLLGQLIRLPAHWRNTLVAAGAGAAIATAFHAPITGAIFAMEIVLIQFSARSFALVALASVTAAQFSRLLVGGAPFPIPTYEMHSSWEIAVYLGLGLAIAPLARLYINILYGAESFGQRLKALPGWLKPAVGGILFGAVAIFVPQTLGGGYDTITDALAGQLPMMLLLTLLAAKLLTIALTSGSGWPGGVFTPALFLGSMAGGAYGLAAAKLLPGVVAQPAAYAVVGMAAMIAGATHAPLTAMTLIFEVTRDYRIALPAMLACGMAAVFSQHISHYSIDTLHLPDEGVLLPWQVQDLREVHVGEGMSTQVHTVRMGMPLKDVIATMQRFRHGGYPVLDHSGRLAGMVTLRDVRSVPLETRLVTPVEKVMSRNLVTITPDLS
ncbi:MAG TPA: chloride channel protein, partial [Symbiobacteriaceae bacterium]|nr:chloride channel protein [Symbiobacteriaceae bacterium]